MRTIVAGSREFFDYTKVKEALDSLDPRPTAILSGTARGADRLGERYALEHSIPLERYPADWRNNKKSAGIKRNLKMAEKAERLVAFWDGRSTGTHNMIDTARVLHLQVTVVYV